MLKNDALRVGFEAVWRLLGSGQQYATVERQRGALLGRREARSTARAGRGRILVPTTWTSYDIMPGVPSHRPQEGRCTMC